MTLRMDLSSGTGLPEMLEGLLPMANGVVGVGGNGSRWSSGTCVIVVGGLSVRASHIRCLRSAVVISV